jgi:ATP-dependent RNA helicase DDX55/SPB4
VARFKEQGAHVLVGTPGRIDDVMKRCSAMDLKRLEVLVLDEADRLLDMGFKQQLDNIMGRLPR